MDAKNKKKILLIIVHCADHLNTEFLRNIKVVFFPDNCSSQPQPLDLGIICAFKCSYRKQLMQETIAMMADCFQVLHV
jgi:hypothetical protein